MELKNGYKLIYEKLIDGIKKLFATKNTVPSIEDKPIDLGISAEQEAALKLVYQKEDNLWCSTKNVPTTDDIMLHLTIDGEEVLGPSDGPTPVAPTYVILQKNCEVTIWYKEGETYINHNHGAIAGELVAGRTYYFTVTPGDNITIFRCNGEDLRKT